MEDSFITVSRGKNVLVCFPVWFTESKGEKGHESFEGAGLEKKLLSLKVPLRLGAAVVSSRYPGHDPRVLGIQRRQTQRGGEKIQWEIQHNFPYSHLVRW